MREPYKNCRRRLLTLRPIKRSERTSGFLMWISSGGGDDQDSPRLWDSVCRIDALLRLYRILQAHKKPYFGREPQLASVAADLGQTNSIRGRNSGEVDEPRPSSEIGVVGWRARPVNIRGNFGF